MEKYPSLRLIAWYSRVFAWGQFICGIFYTIYLYEKSLRYIGSLGSYDAIFLILIFANIPLLIIFLAFSDLINVAIDIEENTRRSSFTETYQISKIENMVSNLDSNVNYKSTLELKNKLMQKGYVVIESNTSEGRYKCEVKKGTTLKYFYSVNEFIAFASNETD